MSDLSPPPIPPFVEFAGGSVGGALQVLVGQPLDTLKTRAQTAPPGQFKGTLDILQQTVRKEGALALYKGTLSPLIGISAVNSLLFAAFGFCKRVVSPYPELTIGQVALAGSGAGAINAVLAAPVEQFKIRMQGQYGSKDDKKLWAVISDQYRQHGLRNGIMRGYWITVVREIPAYAGFYAAYETVKRRLERVQGSTLYGEGKTATFLTAGAAGGLGYWLSCYPLDVIKSKVQLAPQPPQRGLGYIAAEFNEIVAKGGPSALFRGIVPSLIRAVPAAAVTFLGYEITKEALMKA